MFRYLIIFLLAFSALKAQSREEEPQFYIAMKSANPNVYVVDSLYEIYRNKTSNEFSPEVLKAIKAEKQKHKEPRSSWLSNARKESAPMKKEFRSEYEKEYLEWRKEVQPYINEKGFVEYPTEREMKANFSTQPKTKKRTRRSLFSPRSANASSIYDSEEVPYHATFEGWHYYGPVQMLTNDGRPHVTSQANVRAFAQSASNPNYAVCAVENGTIYVSKNKGGMWHYAAKNYNIKGVTALSFSASNENVIFAGVSAGWGVGRLYVSRDGGVTWKDITSNFNELPKYSSPGNAISKIISVSVDDNPMNDIVLLATNRGVLRLRQSSVGGEVSYRFEVLLEKGITDVVSRPNHKGEFYALAFNDAKNHLYFYKSTDGGSSWEIKGTAGKGWFEPEKRMQKSFGGRLATSLSNDNIVYAYLIENREAEDNGYLGVYRSDDSGENWTLPNTNGPGRGAQGYNSTTNRNLATFPFQPLGGYTQGFYNCAIVVSPTNPNHIVLGGLNAWESRNGGKSFGAFGGYQGGKQLHPDMQTFFQQKNEDGTVDTWLTTDGGINYSSDFFERENIVRTNGLGGDYWGFDVGEYNTTMGGGMYHNGDSYHVSSYGAGIFKHLGGGESSTGTVLPLNDERQMYFVDFGGVIVSPNLNEGFKTTTPLNPPPPEPYAGGDNQYYTQRDYIGNTYYYVQSKEEKAKGEAKLYYFSSKENKSLLLEELQFSPNASVQQYVVSFSNPLYQYLMVDNLIYASNDGGKNWTPKNKPFTSGNITFTISDTDPKTIYVLQRYNTKENIIKVSKDGGESYTDLANPEVGINYRHILNVRGTDIIFIFGNNKSKVFYYIDGNWKEYSEDLPFNLSIIEPKIQYRTGEFFMATSGAGIWTRKLPDEVLAKMNILKLNIDAPEKFSYNKEYIFNVTNTSLYYGKNITNITWDFPGATEVTDGNTNTPKVKYNKYGRFGVRLTLQDDKGNSYTHYFPDYLTVYPYCACDVPDAIKNILPHIKVWADASKTNLSKKTLTDRFTGKVYTLAGDAITLKQVGDNKVLNFGEQNNYIDLGKNYEGKTLFIISKLNETTTSGISMLFGHDGGADFHGGGKKGPIFSQWYMTDKNKFDESNGGRTMINSYNSNYFTTNFSTNQLTLYTMRTAQGKSPARVRYISKDRGYANRTWQGEIAEAIIIDKDLTDQEIREINLYLMDKYGIAHSEDTSSDVPNRIPGLVSRINADNVNLAEGTVYDDVSMSRVSIVNKEQVEVKTLPIATNAKVFDMKGGYLQLSKTYEGKTIFVVSKLNPNTTSNFSMLLGHSNTADLHSGGSKGSIFSGWISDRDRFNSTNGGITTVNTQPKDYFNTNFITDRLALYTLRTANGKGGARIDQISKDRGRNDRIWKGEIGEVLIYDRQLTDEEIHQVNQYLMQKFDIK